MFRSIVLDCQTRTAMPYCEDCIARKTCMLRRELARQENVTVEAATEKAELGNHCFCTVT